MNHTSINISYAEDTRDAYHGYSTANISWTKPQGMYEQLHPVYTAVVVNHMDTLFFCSTDHEYLTSYTIFIYTRTERCGGLNNMYTYRNIRKVKFHNIISWYYYSLVSVLGCNSVSHQCYRTQWSTHVWMLLHHICKSNSAQHCKLA